MVYVFLAHGFEEMEAIAPVDILRRGGVAVKIVGIGSKTVTGSHGITIHCDISHREVVLDKIKMIVLPGGMPGATNLEASEVVQKAIDYAVEQHRWIGAICAAPMVLAHKGILDGKKATIYPSRKAELQNAEYINQPVVQDDYVITGNGPGAAIPFGLKLLEVLKGEELAKEIGETLQWQTIH